jgi:hypothetical protein
MTRNMTRNMTKGTFDKTLPIATTAAHLLCFDRSTNRSTHHTHSYWRLFPGSLSKNDTGDSYSPMMRSLSTVMASGLAALKDGNDPFDKIFMPVRIALQDVFLEQLNGARLATTVKLKFNLFKYYNIEHMLKAVILGTEGEKYNYNLAFPEEDVDGLRVCTMPEPKYSADPALQPQDYAENVGCMANELLNYGSSDDDFYCEFLERCNSSGLSISGGGQHWTSLVYGDLDYDKILVDAADQTHLFGFTNIGVGHVLSDIAKLECETLLRCPTIGEDEYTNMIKILTFLANVQDMGAELPIYVPNITDGGGAFADLPPRLRLLWQTVRLLRNFARRYCDNERDPQYYSMALFSHSLRVLGNITEERRSAGQYGDGEPARSAGACEMNAKLARANAVLHCNRLNEDIKELSLIGNGELSPRHLGPALTEGELVEENDGGVMLTKDFVAEGKRYLYSCMALSHSIRVPLMNTSIPIERISPVCSMAGRNPHYKPRGKAVVSREAVMASSGGGGGGSTVNTADLAARARSNSVDDGVFEEEPEHEAAVYVDEVEEGGDAHEDFDFGNEEEEGGQKDRRRSIIPTRMNSTDTKVEVHHGMPDTIREQIEAVVQGVDISNFSIIALLGVVGSGKSATLHKLQYSCASQQAHELAQAEAHAETERKRQRDHWVAQGGSQEELVMLEGGLLSIFDDMHRPDFHMPLMVPLSFFGTLLSTPIGTSSSSSGSIAGSDMLQQYIDHRFVVGSPQHRLISECRRQRRLLLLLDGMGEVTDKHPAVAKYIAAQLAEENHPLLVSTSLPGELPDIVAQISKQMQLLPLSLDEQRRVLEIVLPGGTNHPANEVLADIIKKPLYQQTASNPSQLLMLANAVMTNSLRGSVTGPLLRAKLVSAALEQLIYPLPTSLAPIPMMRVQIERLEHKNSGLDLTHSMEEVFSKQSAVKVAAFKGYLRRLAYDTHQRKARSVTEDDTMEIAAEDHLEAGYPELLMLLTRANAIPLVMALTGGDPQGLMLNQSSNPLLRRDGYARPNTCTLALQSLLMQQFLSMKFLEEEFTLELSDCGGDQDKFAEHVQLIFTEEGHSDYSVVRDPWWRPVLLQCANGMDNKIFAIVLATLKRNAAPSMIDLLEVAVYHADGVAARALLRGGVEPPTVFSKPKSVDRLKLPLHIAVSSMRPNHQFIAALLDVYPMATAHADADGMLPLHNACASGMVQEAEDRKERARLEAEAEKVREAKDRQRRRVTDQDEDGDGMGKMGGFSKRAHPNENEKQQPRARSVSQRSHMRYEARGPSLHLLQMLLKVDRGAAGKEDGNGRLPFHLLCACGSPSPNCTEILFKAHPQAPCERDMMGKRPLHHACASERVTLDLVEFLLDKEKNVVRKTDDEKSKRLPLHYACSNGACSKEVIERLLHEHPRASRLADANGELPVMLLLDEVNPQNTSPRRIIDTVQMLIEAGRATLRRHRRGGEGAGGVPGRTLSQIQEETSMRRNSHAELANRKNNATAEEDQSYLLDELELARKWPQPETESDDEDEDEDEGGQVDLGKKFRRQSTMMGYDDSELESAHKMDEEEEMAARLAWMQSLSLR